MEEKGGQEVPGDHASGDEDGGSLLKDPILQKALRLGKVGWVENP